MEISSAAPSLLAPVQAVSPSQIAPGSTSPFATLQGLASTVLDTSGNISDADKLDAYTSARRLSITGQYAGVGQAGAALQNQIANSPTAQNVEAQRTGYADAMIGAIQQARAAGVPHAQALGAASLQHFDGLSGTDQKALFASINAPNRAGVTPFAGLDDWRGQMAVMGKVSAPVDRIELSGAARALVGASAPTAPTAPAQSAYVTGSIASVRV
jgi:hypothetical protein